MATNIKLKKNDTRPYLRATLLDANSTAIDVTGASVKFIMVDSAGVVKVNDPADIITPAAGIVEYKWQTGDTDTVGAFKGEFEITFGDGKIMTVPNNSYMIVTIIADLA